MNDQNAHYLKRYLGTPDIPARISQAVETIESVLRRTNPKAPVRLSPDLLAALVVLHEQQPAPAIQAAPAPVPSSAPTATPVKALAAPPASVHPVPAAPPRPPKRPPGKRDHLISLRLTTEEKAKLDTLVTGSNMSATDYIVARVLPV